MKSFDLGEHKEYDKSKILCSKRLLVVISLVNIVAMVAVGLGVYYGTRSGTQPKTNTFTSPSTATRLPQTTVRPGSPSTGTSRLQSTPTPTLLPTTTGPSINYRLPTELHPTVYRLSVKVYLPSLEGPSYDPQRNFSFDGHVEIDFEAISDTRNVTINMYKLSNISCTLHHTNNQSIIATDPYTYDSVTQMIVFAVGSAETNLVPGYNYTLKCDYVGYLNDNDEASDGASGFYRDSYMENGITRWLAVTEFEQANARRAFLCFDEPSFKATFEVSITHPSDLTALSNGMESSVKTNSSEKWSTTTFESTLPMSTYLLAMTVFDYQNVSIRANTTKHTLVRAWTPASAASAAYYQAYVGAKVLEFMENYTGVPFPLEKEDLMVVPDFGDAMENWGLVTFDALLFGQGTDVVDTHELAHQWFGDLVTMKWWDNIWLNEGFARYLQYIAVTPVDDNQSWDIEGVYTSAINDFQTVMLLDQQSTSHAIVFPVITPEDMAKAADNIAYLKGAAVLNMMNNIFGDDIFRTSLNIYLTSHAYNNTDYKDLLIAMSQANNESCVKTTNCVHDAVGDYLDVTAYMEGWIIQPGFPLVTVNFANTAAVISQHRFLVDNTSSSVDYSWHVPIWFQCGPSNSIKFMWLVPNAISDANCTGGEPWILVNPGAKAFVRVQYNDQNWQALSEQLRKDNSVFDARAKAQLIDDAFNLAQTDRLDYSIVLGLLPYLRNETSSIPWGGAWTVFHLCYSYFLNSNNYGIFQAYATHIVAPVYNSVGWDDQTLFSGNNVVGKTDHLQHPVVTWACLLAIPECINNSTTLFAAYKQCRTENSTCVNQIPTTLRDVVYCTSIALGDYNAWEFLWNQYLNETDAMEITNLIYGLSCTTQPWIITKLLNEAVLSGNLHSDDDLVNLLKYLRGNALSRVMLWDYLNDNWEYISQHFSDTLDAFILSATAGFNNRYQTQMLATFISEHASELGSALSTANKALQTAKNNEEWVDRNADSVISAMKRYL